MNEPESLRSIARRLIAQHRQKHRQPAPSGDLCVRELIAALNEAIHEPIPIPTTMLFDLSLTEDDSALWRRMHIQVD
jgi:hypothetical protein